MTEPNPAPVTIALRARAAEGNPDNSLPKLLRCAADVIEDSRGFRQIAADLLPLAQAWAEELEARRDEFGHYRAVDAAQIVERAEAALSPTERSSDA